MSKNENKEKKISKWIDLSYLPKWSYGTNKWKIKWSKVICKQYKIKFVYDGICGEIEIVKKEENFLYIRYLDNPPYKICYNSLIQCRLGKLLRKTTSNFKSEIGQTFKDEKRDLIITDREHRKDKNGQNRKWYKYACNKCGWTEGLIEESHLLEGVGCACCSNRKAVLGINTIWDTDRWMCDLGVSEEDAKTHTHSSNDKITVICPDCGRVKPTKIVINNIYNKHSIGCTCGDNVSYSEKLIYSLLNQLKVNFITQYITKWSNNKRYDFYFNYNNESYVIEVNGIQHYKESPRGRKLQEEQSNDKYKKELAILNGIKEENYIVIDCRKSELDFIKNNILNSRLNEIFDLSKIDWLKCEKFTLSNLVKQTCDIKKENPDMTTTEISKTINISRDTVRNYLKKGTKLDWCYYNPKIEKTKSDFKGKQVYILKNGKCLGLFSSCSELSRRSRELFGVELDSKRISDVANNKIKLYRGFIFKYIK